MITEQVEIKALTDTFLKKSPDQASELPTTLKLPVPTGKTYPVVSYQPAASDHYKIELDYEAGTWYVFTDHWDLGWEDTLEDDRDVYEEFLTESNLRQIMPGATTDDIRTYTSPINRVLYDFDIATSTRAAAFIAQIAHESGQLRYKEEMASGDAYEGRRDLGNVRPGDGRRYKGRGLIQLTGRANYRQAGQALNLPLEDDPLMVVRDPYLNAAVAGWYWQSRDINSAADRNDFQLVTRLINGGLNGYQDRLNYWERSKTILVSTKTTVTMPEINWNDFNAKVSKYFTVREVVNADRRRIPQSDEIKDNILIMAEELDQVREGWGSAILVTSWYRPPAINRAVGGARNSQHLSGRAVDVRPAQGNIYQFQDWLDTQAWSDKALGYGAPRGFVHLDLRPGRIRWVY